MSGEAVRIWERPTTSRILDGNEAAVRGVALSRPEVIAVFPITPQTEVGNHLADIVARGDLEAEFVTVQNEHAAMSVVAGASATGARTFTASSSQGVVLMEEPIWMVPGYRLPVVMAICNRSIAFPGGLRPTHSDSLLQRDSGWIQLYCENAQEVLDTAIQSYKIAEDERVCLPTFFIQDGYTTTATAMPVEIPEQEDVDDFLPSYKHPYGVLDPDNPPGIEVGERWDTETEERYQIDEAMENAKTVIKEVNDEYGERFGRRYGNGLIEKYRCDDARGVLITMSSIAGTARMVVDEMRDEGEQIGLVKLRSFRPFPTEDLREIGEAVEAIGFVDRNFSHGSSARRGIGCTELASALYPLSLEDRPQILDFIAGIGGRDVTPKDIRYMAEKVLKTCETGRVEREVEWIQLRR